MIRKIRIHAFLLYSLLGLAILWGSSASADSFVAVGSNGKTVHSEDNGASWTISNNPRGSMRGIAFGDGRFVAVGTTITSPVVYSGDGGQTWMDPATKPSNRLLGVAYANGRFVAVGESGYGAYSDDGGNTWSDTTIGNAVRAVAFGNNTYVAVGLGGAALQVTQQMESPGPLQTTTMVG